MAKWESNPFDTSIPTTQMTRNTGYGEGYTYGKKGLDYGWDQLHSTDNVYKGANPFAHGPSEFENKRRATLGGLQNQYTGPGGRWDTAYGVDKGVSGMSADAYNIGDRSGGPDAGYFDPYRGKMKEYMRGDYVDALADMESQVGAGAYGANAFGSSRHGVASGVGGAKAMDNYLRAATQMDSQAFENAMQWQNQDQQLQGKLAMQANQDKLGFGQLNLAQAQGAVGESDWQKEMLGKNWLSGQFDKQLADKRQLYRDYMTGVDQTPWGTSETRTGFGGKSNLDKTAGYSAIAAKIYFNCIPEGTEIDTPNGKVPIEDIKAGTKVKGYYKAETEVLQVHQYKEDPGPHRFYHITFDNGNAVDCCDMHRIYNKRAKD